MTVRALAVCLLAMLLAPILFAGPSARAQESEMMRDKMIERGDYDQFEVPGPGGARACAETCANDPRCRAWTFVRPARQCRLKHEVGQVVDNPCCVSGMKPVAGRAADEGGKPALCADYARAAVAANADNVSQGCQLQGSRWSDDFQAHYSWCMGVHRDDAAAQTQARTSDLARCQQASGEDATAKCDHFARISMVQVETARKAHCVLPAGDRRWSDDIEAHRRACLDAPARVLAHAIAEREAVLSSCLAAAGEARQACEGYADRTLEQVRAAATNGCDVTGQRWSTSRPEQIQWCFAASPDARRAELEARGQQLAQCSEQAAKHRDCDQYAEGAVQQALRNVNEDCGFHGPVWSRYKDEHVAFCMQAGAPDRDRAAADRDAALQQCQNRAQLNPECDDYAKHAVRIAEVNRDRTCGYDGEGWTTEYREHYRFCLRSNSWERRARMMEQRQALFTCSVDHGFRLELGFF